MTVLSLSSSTRLPACWCTKLAEVCTRYNTQPTQQIVNEACYLQYTQESLADPILLLFPPIILWSPIEHFQHLLQETIITCPKCDLEQNVPLHPTGWCNGVQGDRSQPRKIYGADGITLLVGRVYKCSKGHEVMSYHPSLLQYIPNCFIPFRLWHKTGFTSDFIDSVVALVAAGMSLSAIRDFYYKKQLSLYYNRKAMFDQLDTMFTSKQSFPSIDTWKTSFSSFVPSIHAISGCFLADFWKKDITYVHNMQSTTIDEDSAWLSLDHTFSSTSKCLITYRMRNCMN